MTAEKSKSFLVLPIQSQYRKIYSPLNVMLSIGLTERLGDPV